MNAKINIKRYLMAGVAVFIAISALDFLVHNMLLMGLYEQTASVWRPKPEANSMMWMMIIGTLLFAFALAWFYTKGYEAGKSGPAQGMRFGVYAGILLVAAQNFVWYVVLPVPFILNLSWLASSFVDCVVGGLLIGFIYHD